MKSEPTLIVEAIRAAMILLVSFGVALNADQQAAIIGAAGAFIAVGSLALAFLNRSKVFAPDSVEVIAANAAATGDPTVGAPPRGDVPPGSG